MNPNSGSRVEPEAVEGTSKSKNGTPEAVRYMLVCWAVMIAGELLHQILTVVSVVIDPAPLKESARAAAKARGQELTDAMISTGVWGSVTVMALIQLVFLGLFTAALVAISQRRKWAPNARRILQIFSIFFALRALTLFMMRPASTAVPVAFYAFDGVIQIILAVAGVLGLFYSSQKEALDYLPDQRPPQGPAGA
ncbi:hypothetical protein JZY91_00775 [Corynebacterium sp. CNCTC7651]|nr:hypothetical protein [Corynebacterium sp. CNCTC7651]UIZ92384.1 hypothetical protein JZY91_00775 [Corynebacterium sp. CNCTC7651]